MPEALATETPAASAAPAAPAAPADNTPVAPAAPVQAKEPVAQSPDTTPVPTRREAYKADRKKREDAALASVIDRFGGKKKGEPATPAPTATPNPAPKAEEEATPPNPADPAAAPPAPAPVARDDRRKESITVKDREGKDIEVTLDQARRAILRDGADADFVQSLTKTKLLEYGSKRLLAQQDQDRFGNEAQGWRRAAEGKAQLPQNPPTVQPKAPEAPAAPQTGQPPANPQQSPSDGSAVPQAQTAWKQRIAAFREVAGDDAANALESTLSDMAGEMQTATQTQLQQSAQMYQQASARMSQMLVDREFRDAFSRLEADFPQLKDEKIREEIKQDAFAVGNSTRFADPFAAIPTIVRELAYGRFGDQQKETAARKLLERQSRRSEGQVDVGTARGATPAGALSPEALSAAAFKEFQRTGNHDAARQKSRELQTASG